MRTISELILVMALFLFCQCDKVKTEPIQGILTIEEILPVLEACQKDALTKKSKIEKKIVGEWTLVGYGCGFCEPHEPPKATLKMEKNKGVLEYEDEYNGVINLAFDWTIEASSSNLEYSKYKLITEPLHFALYMDVFCDDFMYFDHRPFDGNLMLYQKQ